MSNIYVYGVHEVPNADISSGLEKKSRSRKKKNVKPAQEGNKPDSPPAPHIEYEHIQSIRFEKTRNRGEKIKIDTSAGNIAKLSFEDGSEWIGDIGEIEEIYGESAVSHRTGKDAFVLKPSIRIHDATDERGGIKEVFIKILDVFKVKENIAETTGYAIAKWYDGKMMPRFKEGDRTAQVFGLNREMELIDTKDEMPENHKSLLLIHGTGSDTFSSFKGLIEGKSNVWNGIYNRYEENVFALEHWTWSVSPLENAYTFLKHIENKKNVTLDIIGYSRGGIVADILARCDKRNDIIGFSKEEKDSFERDIDEKIEEIKERIDKKSVTDLLWKNKLRAQKEALEALRELPKKINEIAGKKILKVEKVVRVACPSDGTTLLSHRLDHFLNALLSAIGMVTGLQGTAYNYIKSFLLDVVRQKEKPDAVPGLWAMMPDSPLQKIMNNLANPPIKNDLYVITGDAEVGGNIWHSTKVILSNLYYKEANDFVIDTERMTKGTPRLNTQVFASKDKYTHHFNYFINENTQKAIVEALHAEEGTSVASFVSYSENKDASRGTIGLILRPGIQLEVKDISGNRPVAVVLPGIMGSNLSVLEEKKTKSRKKREQRKETQQKEEIWFDLRKIIGGGIVKSLSIEDGNTNVVPDSLIGEYYSDFINYLQDTHDVVTFPYDWRLSVQESAKLLNDKLSDINKELSGADLPIHIIAHSMGGLVVRQLMMDHEEEWRKFMRRKNTKCIMLGTPWLGSYDVLKVLLGHSKRVKTLARLDIKYKLGELLNTIRAYPGIYQLLPVDNRDFENEKFWEKEFEVAGLSGLEAFKTFKEDVKKFDNGTAESYWDNIWYIAGQKKKTPFDYRKKEKASSDKGKEETEKIKEGKKSPCKIIYRYTTEGDGSVTWHSGIPQHIPEDNLYFARTEHMELVNDEKLFEGIVEILLKGKTNEIPRDKPVARSGKQITEEYEDVVARGLDLDDEMKTVFGVGGYTQRHAESRGSIHVVVTNGHLRNAAHPVLVGHFSGDGIVSAERAIDYCLENRLSERHSIGNYPGRVGENEIFFNLDTHPKGTIVVGLGSVDNLTQYVLASTVEKAVIRYAMFMRDNYTTSAAKKHANGISCLLVGSGYGRLHIEESLRGILLGVSNANLFIKKISGKDLKSIEYVEFVDYYQEMAQKAYYGLNNIKNTDKRINFTLQEGIKEVMGSRKRHTYDDAKGWWHNFTTRQLIDENNKTQGLTFSSSSGIARVENEDVYTGLEHIQILLDTVGRDVEWEEVSNWDGRLSKAIFELLIPNNFKDTIRNHHNILWKMDLHSAQFPWEMFHDSDYGDEPAFINSGLIRQLYTDDYCVAPTRGQGENALIIGDPIYGNSLSQLPAAVIEAKEINKILEEGGCITTPLINTKAKDIMLELYAGKFRILHFAAHGLYNVDKENGVFDIGIAIGDGVLLTTGLIRQLSVIPEFVFINCCYSGKISEPDNAYYMSRYKFAANVGIELIRMGVKATIIAGWPVNDAAAKTFAVTFYEKMMAGYEFGEAVKIARKKCYDNYPYTNTWGAYQCYGDQFYKLTRNKGTSWQQEEYIMHKQVHIDLENLLSKAKDDANQVPIIIKELDKIIERAQKKNLIDGIAKERIAEIYAEVDMIEDALDTYEDLLEFETANYTIRALEQYYNLRAKLMVKKRTYSKTADSDADKKIQEMIDVFESTFGGIGITKERLSILGSAYKRAAQIASDKKNKAQFLNKMAEKYGEAYRRYTDKEDTAVIYPLTNFITACWFKDQLDSDKKDKRDTLESKFKEYIHESKKPYNVLEEMDKKLLSIRPQNKDFYEDIAPVNIKLCLLLLEKNTASDKIRAIATDINRLYKDAKGRSGTSNKKIRTEIEHIEFLLNCWLPLAKEETLRYKEEALRRVLKELKMLIEEG